MKPDRRGLLTLAGIAGLVAACGSESPRPRSRSRRIRYGTDHPDQFGDLVVPARPRALAVLLHGGYWSAEYGADLMTPLADDLAAHGIASWNLEYRRVGDGGGWPTTFTDVAAGVDHAAVLPGVRGLPVLLLGHSAGGQLAVWAASRHAPAVRPRATLSLSGVLDLAAAAAEGLGGGAALALLGGTPAQQPARYAAADPLRLVPAGGPVVAFHAAADEVVPRSQSTAYVAADSRAGGTASLVLVPGGHFDLIDPTSPAWARIRSTLLARADPHGAREG